MERAGLIGGVMMKKIPTDSTYAVTGDTLKKIVEKDKEAGLIPFYVRHTHFKVDVWANVFLMLLNHLLS